MLRMSLVYGAISGVLVIVLMVAGMQSGLGHSVWFGFLSMFIVLSLIFVGIKRYRDRERGGVIGFWPALGLGLSIAAIAGVFYVIAWDITLHLTDFAFVGEYLETMRQSFAAKGLSGEALAEKMADWEAWAVSYRNPLYRWPMTFVEIFPVGVVVALVSAGLLCNPRVFPARA